MIPIFQDLLLTVELMGLEVPSQGNWSQEATSPLAILEEYRSLSNKVSRVPMKLVP